MDNDLISRTALKASIFDMPKPKGNLNFWDGIDACGDIIDNAPAVNSWIPVSERLPKKDGCYLVTREEYTYIDTLNRIKSTIVDIARFSVTHEYNRGFHKANRVIAWQPMPKEYKGE